MNELVELQQFIEQGLSTSEIAKKLGISQSKVVRTLKKYGLRTKHSVARGRWADKIEGQCLNCDKFIPNRNIYCNSRCQQEHKYKVYIYEWKQGMYDGLRGGLGISKHIRRYLFEKYESKCSQCGWGKINTFTNLIPLEVEHIDGNHENNSEGNLTLLCPNCHSLTSTFRALNKGNGRAARKSLLVTSPS